MKIADEKKYVVTSVVFDDNDRSIMVKSGFGDCWIDRSNYIPAEALTEPAAPPSGHSAGHDCGSAGMSETPAAGTPRKIVQIVFDGEDTVHAVADDGTLWAYVDWVGDKSFWKQFPPLPDHAPALTPGEAAAREAAAFTRGVEAMREAAARIAVHPQFRLWTSTVQTVNDALHDAIRNLPLPGGK